MYSFLIFLPVKVFEEKSCHLFGKVFISKEENTVSFYILSVFSCDTEYVTDEDSIGHRYIGHYSQMYNATNEVCERSCSNMLLLGKKCNQLILKKIMIEGAIMNVPSQKIIFLTYDLKKYLNTEMLFMKYNSQENGNKGNYLKILVNSIEWDMRMLPNSYNQGIRAVIMAFLMNVELLLTYLLRKTISLLPVLKYSSLCLRVHNSLQSFTWVLSNFISSGKLSLKAGNYLSAILLDILCGVIILYWFMAMSTAAAPSQLLLNTAEGVVETLQELLKWLMGIPAGLKLNFAFNNMLGKFFLYHINLWWTFLVLAEPVLNLMFIIFLWFGRLGLSFQAAILADLLALVSFHIYCIYVYAARLYNLQISGLLSLWRLFLGRKKNPLRERVDSCQYTTNQLFIGTLAFTILLFLLPTTFMYYIVFTTLRLLVAALAGLLIRIQFLLQMLPLYTSVLWLIKSTYVNSSLNIQLERRKPGLPLILSINPLRGSLWTIIQNSSPEHVERPPCILWGSLLKNILTGQLIYPM